MVILKLMRHKEWSGEGKNHLKCTMFEEVLYNTVNSDYYIHSEVVPIDPSSNNVTGASVNTVDQCVNASVVSDVSETDGTNINNWWALLALALVLGTATGNILVCLAITWERRLQNVTNYFLMSLAITDLMVAVLVMPLGILTLVRGKSRSCWHALGNFQAKNIVRRQRTGNGIHICMYEIRKYALKHLYKKTCLNKFHLRKKDQQNALFFLNLLTIIYNLHVQIAACGIYHGKYHRLHIQ